MAPLGGPSRPGALGGARRGSRPERPSTIPAREAVRAGSRRPCHLEAHVEAHPPGHVEARCGAGLGGAYPQCPTVKGGKQEVSRCPHPPVPPSSPPALAALSFAGAAIVADTASAGSPVSVIVLKEHGVGTTAAAQPGLDQFIAIAAKDNGWDPASKGRYETTRSGADTFIAAEKPHYGIFTLAAFLAYMGP